MRRTALTLTAAVLVLTGCGSSGAAGTTGAAAPSSAGSGSAAPATASGTVNVVAASARKEAFTALGATCEAASPGT